MSNQHVNAFRDMSWSGMAERRPLPVQFALYPSRKTNGMLCPCLTVRHTNVELIRILDPEHKQPFFSIDGMFLLAGLSVPNGLLRFDLRRERGDYDVTLAGLEPREGIWSPFNVAQRIAMELGLSQLLKTFFSVKHAWSLDEGELNGVVHNWQPAKDQINPSKYSFESLSNDAFDSFSLIKSGQPARTPIGNEERDQIKRIGKPCLLLQDGSEDELQHSRILTSFSLEQRLLRWTVMATAQWHEFQQQVSDAQSAENTQEDSLMHIWSPSTVEILLFFSDLQSPSNDDDRNIAYSLNEGQIVVTKSQLQEAHLRHQEQQGAKNNPLLSIVDVNAVLALVDSLWIWYIERIAHSNKAHMEMPQETMAQEKRSNEESGIHAISQRLNRLEASFERMEASLNTLLHNQTLIQKEKVQTEAKKPVNPNKFGLFSMDVQTLVYFFVIGMMGTFFSQYFSNR
ncbi:uncharacterized protein FA14DRAFT_68528 [Meira miltonrushii]|uniref:Uncharacterized protein n=1 Tax=Meira miltonrushii TaxID=1280837 RepID=A0A316V922_9BASI|nr:uncharacterized protein FA14DRAFT_68528 [Meira miltonrushii]PWN34099.1 hypothetical protein FA14DRAFT_68528 [Meira miltonrushii]